MLEEGAKGFKCFMIDSGMDVRLTVFVVIGELKTYAHYAGLSKRKGRKYREGHARTEGT